MDNIVTKFSNNHRDFVITDITKDSDEFLVSQGLSPENSFVYKVKEGNGLPVGLLIGSTYTYDDGSKQLTYCMEGEDNLLIHKMAIMSAKNYLEENC